MSTTIQPSTPQVHVSWKITGSVDSVYDAVDSSGSLYSSGLPASGSATFTRSCDGSAHSYFVVAVSHGQKTIRSGTVPAAT